MLEHKEPTGVVDYLTKRPEGGFIHNDKALFVLGEEGNFLVCFDHISDADFLSLCHEYEKNMEYVESSTPYLRTAIRRRRVHVFYNDGVLNISWHRTEHPDADTLVTMLVRW